LDGQRRRGSPPHSFAFFRNVYNLFKPQGLLRMLFATYDDKPIGGIMVFCFRDKAYDWNAVTHAEYRSLNPNNFLLWHIIEWAKSMNLKILDLGRTRPQDRGVYHFKRGWGGNQIDLNDYVFFIKHREIPDPTQNRYVYLSKIWSLMPMRLVELIGPKIIDGIGL